MPLTPQDLGALRNILTRAVNDIHEVLVAAARRQDHAAPPPANPPPPSPAPRPRLAYSLAETSKRLGLSKATLYRLIARGELKAVRVGSRRLVEAAEIERLLARGRQDL
jgi:excisionase family DNA binding protein